VDVFLLKVSKDYFFLFYLPLFSLLPLCCYLPSFFVVFNPPSTKSLFVSNNLKLSNKKSDEKYENQGVKSRKIKEQYLL